MLQVVARLQTTSFMQTLTGTGVHPAESYVLHELWKECPLSQSELSLRLRIGNATIGKTLKRLEKGGFITRSRAGDDQRRVMVRVTDKGYAAHERFAEATMSLIETIEGVLGPSNSELLLDMLNALSAQFQHEAEADGI